ncbi:MAG: glycosyltransferase [Actinomycetota bacterium]
MQNPALSTDPAPPPLKLLIFAHALPGRGLGRSVIRLLKSFDRSAVSPLLVVVDGRGRFQKEVPDDVPVYDLGLSGRSTSAALPAVHRIIRSIRPDCALGVHTAPSRLLGLLRVIHPRLKVICWEGDPLRRVERDKGHFLVRRLVTSLSHRLASKIVACTEDVATDVRESLWLSPTKVVVIPHPCMDDQLLEQAKERATDPPFDRNNPGPVIINIGNMYLHKSQATLLEGFALVRQRRNASLVIIGEGPLRERLESLAVDLGVSDDVYLLGYETNPFKFLASSSIFVSPSSSEGFELAQIEAMACGIPVIVTDVPRFKAVEHTKSGLLIPAGDPPALAEAVERLLDDPDLAREVARAARTIANELSSEKISRRFVKLFEEVCERNGAAA